MTLEERLKAQAAELGFAACGIAALAPANTALTRLVPWLETGHHAGMNWMARPDGVEKRGDPRLLLPGARSIICVALHYRTSEAYDAEDMGGIARYARGLDYHDFLPNRLRVLLAWLQAEIPCEGKVCVDTAPILEREWAQRAGLGWIGKNTLLMSRQLGSYVLLGEILITAPLVPDEPHAEQFCGTCTRCMDACPTGAITAPHVLDANKCISYHTIENRKLAPRPLREQFQDWVFGCDICQEVCPWNDKSAHNPAAYSPEPALFTRPEMPHLREWTRLTQEEFSRRLKNSPLKRAKRRGLRRNAARALRNRRNAAGSGANPSMVFP